MDRRALIAGSSEARADRLGGKGRRAVLGLFGLFDEVEDTPVHRSRNIELFRQIHDFALQIVDLTLTGSADVNALPKNLVFSV